MAKQFLNDFRVDALAHEERRGGMPELMESYPWKPGPLQQGILAPLQQVGGLNRPTDQISEDKAPVLPHRAHLEALL